LAREYHWVHVLPNAAVVVIALMRGEGDFTRSIGIATSCGLDVDSNGGVVGGIMGAAVGAAAIPERLKAPLGDAIDTWVSGFQRVDLVNLARRTCRMGWRISDVLDRPLDT
jgi:ADP-ribosylglycohydrolase